MSLFNSGAKAALCALVLAAPLGAFAQAGDPGVVGATETSMIPKSYARPNADQDYIKRVEMVPMRDGTKLYTVIVSPKGATGLPIIMTRTPYNAKARASRNADAATMLEVLPLSDEPFVESGYIRVYQDVRGKYGSEGAYQMTRPVIGPLNATKVDHVTDAWDTIDWLVKNVPGNNGKVGMIGSSYEGFTVVMALLDPHPALKAAIPESPMIDGWVGDDWFQNGAFRQNNMDFFVAQTAQTGAGSGVVRPIYDDYETFLKFGSPGEYAKAKGIESLPWWQVIKQHPSYDAYWQGTALDKLLAKKPSTVPTLWEQGLWDQEDIYGAVTAFAALKAAGHEANNWLVMGPWFHSQINREGYNLGVFKWNGDTAMQFRREMVLPFFNQYLKDGPPANLARATVYNPAENRWEKFPTWPMAPSTKPLYLTAGFGLSFDKPAAAPRGQSGGDSYVSDPAKPVTHLPRPVKFSDSEAWRTWLVRDQRFVDGRPDVLTYSTPALTEAVTIRGAPIADIVATTTGTDGDFIVKLIDVFPDQVPSQPELGGYQLPVSLEIFRGRYRDDPSKPTPIPAGKAQHYRFEMPSQNYVFKPGHKIMVQIQSTLFPLYDRNPQVFLPNPLLAKSGDHKAATVTVLRAGENASAIYLPVVQ